MMTKSALFFLFALSVFCSFSLPALAAPDFSQIFSWPRQLQTPATPAMEHITEFHTMLLYIISGVVLFVTALLLIVIVRFNAKANPVPSTTSHNVMLEVLWTVVPVVILIVIAVPSFKLLFFEARNPAPELTVKVTGHQWNWEYEYPDNGAISFVSNRLKDNEIDPSKGQLRLLSTDSPMVVPVDTNIVFEVTASDVIHSFAVPAFGIKIDAVPGRLNSSWARVTKTGTYYGQCSEICGTGHGFMPIEIKVVPKEDFAAWIKEQGGTMPQTSAQLEATDAVIEVDAVSPEAPVQAPADAVEVLPAELPVPQTEQNK